MTSSVAEATAAREAGNNFFKAGEFAKANQRYAEAIALLVQAKAEGDDAVAVGEATIKCRLNSAACLLKLQGYAAAVGQCRAVIEAEPDNAKAHFRLGQALSSLGDLPAAQQVLTDAIKLNPSLREPRDALSALRARLKANPRLEQALQDMSLVEERALRSLNTADVKRARQGLELLLKDARANKETHWESRALLGLALLCQDEGEAEAAQDYLEAARRTLGAASDRRAEIYCLQTHGLITLDCGMLSASLELFEGGRLLAEEMGEMGLVARFGANLAVVHTLRGSLDTALEYADAALEAARSKQDRHFEAVAAVSRAHALRLAGRDEEAKAELAVAITLAESLGYSHVLAAGLRNLAHMQLATKSPEVELKAVEHLQRAHAIAKNNGLLRAACDDACNLYATCLRLGVGYDRDEALVKLEKAMKQAEALGYGRAHVDLLLALALGHMRLGRHGWQSDAAELDAAEAHLEAALELLEEGSATHAQALGHRTLCHLLRASAARATSSGAANDGFERTRKLPPHSEAVKALRCAARAVDIYETRKAEGVGTGADAAALTNLAIAMLLSERTAADDAPDATAAAAAARSVLERALIVCAAGDEAQRQKAGAAMVGVLEMQGETEAAITHALELMSSGSTTPCSAAQRLIAVGDRHRAAADMKAALAAYKEAFRLHAATA